MEWIDAKTIVMNSSPIWDYVAFEYSMNIYRGCSHGCIYCYARSEFYEKTGDFDQIRAKKNALQIIRDDLRRKTRKGMVHMGGISDPYNPMEKELCLIRNALELLNAFSFGACVFTKSALVTRDTDVYLDIKEHSPVSVNFSITCADDEMCAKIEPRVSPTSERFKAIEHLSKNGIVAGVLMDPVIPYITDTTDNVREMVKKAKHHGARFIYISTQVTMADAQREYFYREAEKHYPGISDTYRAKYKSHYYCRSPRSAKLWNAFVEECEKVGLCYDMKTANRMIRHGYDLSAPYVPQ